VAKYGLHLKALISSNQKPLANQSVWTETGFLHFTFGTQTQKLARFLCLENFKSDHVRLRLTEFIHHQFHSANIPSPKQKEMRGRTTGGQVLRALRWLLEKRLWYEIVHCKEGTRNFYCRGGVMRLPFHPGHMLWQYLTHA